LWNAYRRLSFLHHAPMQRASRASLVSEHVGPKLRERRRVLR
jgi:hypothetical protein